MDVCFSDDSLKQLMELSELRFGECHINKFDIHEYLLLINSSENNMREAERQLFNMAAIAFSDEKRGLHYQGNGPKYFDIIQMNIYAFLNGLEPYDKNKATYVFIGASTIEYLTDSIFKQVGVGSSAVSLIVSLTLCLIIKISIKSWCEFYSNRILTSPELSQILKKIAGEGRDGR